MKYRSKYYDPVKAHEYYLKRRKLKGRKKKSRRSKSKNRLSTKGMTPEQLMQAQLAKAQAKAQQKILGAGVNKQISEEKKAIRKQFDEQCKAKIEELKQKIEALPPEQKEAAKTLITQAIQNIQIEFEVKKEMGYNAVKEKYKSQTDALKANYKATLGDAYDRIRKG